MSNTCFILVEKNYVEVQDKKKPSALPEPIKCNPLDMYNNKFSKIQLSVRGRAARAYCFT